jgi:CotH protein.
MKIIRILPLLAVSLALFSCEKEGPVTSGEEITEGKVDVTNIRINGTNALLNSETGTFTAILPTETDFSSMDISFVTKANSILMGNRELASSNTDIDLSEPRVIRFVRKGIYQDYTIVVRNTGLPIVRIETPGKKAVTSKTAWMDGATIRIERPDGSVDYEGSLEIKGRGNSTWNYPKKPYALRLKEKDEILGMPSHKRWVLLANWKDRTILRNDAAFWLSRHTGLPYTVRGQFVELVFNGQHKGNYYLCEQIKLNKKRVNIEKMDPMETDPEKITGGWLLELDTYVDMPGYVDETHKFRFPNLFNLPWIVKDPDDDEISDVAYMYILGWIKDLETLMKDSDKVRAHAYEEFLDVDTAIDYLLVEELTGNNDFYNYWPSPGPHSTYLYKARGGKLYHGPVWDFDYHVFCPQYTHQWVGATKSIFYPALLKDEKFRARLVERWDMQKNDMKKLPEYIDGQADRLRESERINHDMWPISNDENGDEKMSFQESVDRIKSAFLDKWEWMDQNIRNLKM